MSQPSQLILPELGLTLTFVAAGVQDLKDRKVSNILLIAAIGCSVAVYWLFPQGPLSVIDGAKTLLLLLAFSTMYATKGIAFGDYVFLLVVAAMPTIPGTMLVLIGMGMAVLLHLTLAKYWKRKIANGYPIVGYLCAGFILYIAICAAFGSFI